MQLEEFRSILWEKPDWLFKTDEKIRVSKNQASIQRWMELPETYIYITDEQQIIDIFLPDLIEYKKAFINKKMLLGFDIESYWTDDAYIPTYKDNVPPMFVETDDGDLEGKDRLIQIGLKPTIFDRQYVFDTYYITEEMIIKYLKVLLEDEAIIVGQNIKYDLGCLAKRYGIFPKEVRCTQIIAQKRYAGDDLTTTGQKRDFKLATLYKKFIPLNVFLVLMGMDHDQFDRFKHKYQKSNWREPKLSKNQLKYSASDVRAIMYLYQFQLEECARFQQMHPQSRLIENIKIECNSLIEVAIAETAGIAFDSARHEDFVIPYLEAKLKEAEEALMQIPELWVEVTKKKTRTRNKIKESYEVKETRFAKLAYSPDLIKVLKNLGYDNFEVSKKGNESCDKEAFNEIFWRCELGPKKDILAQVYKFRLAKTFLSKNGANQLAFVHSNGRVHPNYFVLAAKTGRMAAKDPAVMTIPSRDPMYKEVREEFGEQVKLDAFYLYRGSYVATNVDWFLIDGDFKNQEVRLVGDQSGDEVIVDAFQRDLDLHQITADNLGVDRETGKEFYLSAQYGAYENTIIENLYEKSGGEIDFIGRKEAVTELRNKHFEKYAGLAEWIQEAKDHVIKSLEPFDSLAEFANRKPIFIGFTKIHGAHELWCLNAEQERLAFRINKQGAEDVMHRNYRAVNPKTGKSSTFVNIWNKTVNNIAREYVNFLIQAEGGIMIKKSMSYVGKAFREQGWCPYKDAGFRIPFHDEIVTEARKELVEQATEIQRECMLRAFKECLKGKVPPGVDIGTGYRWNEAKPGKKKVKT